MFSEILQLLIIRLGLLQHNGAFLACVGLERFPAPSTLRCFLYSDALKLFGFEFNLKSLMRRFDSVPRLQV
jgi:hypothetical protein